MKMKAPKAMTFYIAAALAVLGLLGSIIPLSIFTDYSFTLVLAGFVVLALGVLFPNM